MNVFSNCVAPGDVFSRADESARILISGCENQTVSIITPVLNEAAIVAERLSALARFRADCVEIIVVDGGSSDATVACAGPHADRVLRAPRGRARQMNAGAAQARGDILLFLHADTLLPPCALEALRAGLASANRSWGRFDVEIVGRSRLLPVVALFMNLRSRLTGVATGDQAIFVRRAAFARVGGFPDIALMEDVALSARLKRLGRPLCLRQRVRTSGRRWDEKGALRTIFLMWRLRLRFFFGADPNALARAYGYSVQEE